MLIALLLIVTFLSLGLAAGMLVYVLRLTREERDRSDARAAALAEMLTGASGAIGAADATGLSPVAAPAAEADATGAGPLELWTPTFSPSRYHISERDAPAAPVVPDAPVAPVAPDAPVALVRFPLLVPAVGVLVVGLIGGVALGVVSARNRASATATTGTLSQGATAPLELVALRHERSGDGLVISGVVRNPQGGRVALRLSAVAFLFDREGHYLTSGRAPLDYMQLQPGEESPFSIAVPSASSVSRYRVTFRTDAGIISHVDRRGDPPVVPAASR